METIYADNSAIAPIKFKINRAAKLRIHLQENGVAVTSTAGWTWQLVLKKNDGAILNIWSLTLGNGLRYEIYSDYILIADITPLQNSIEEGDYWIELIRTDLAMTRWKGVASYSYR